MNVTRCITPSHNLPHDGWLKYNTSHGGPAESNITDWIETRANAFLEKDLHVVKSMPFEKVLHAAKTHRHDYLNSYIADLAKVIDLGADCRTLRVALHGRQRGRRSDLSWSGSSARPSG